MGLRPQRTVRPIRGDRAHAEPGAHPPHAVGGFPEWLPEVRMIELRWIDRIREVFERYGFCPIETRSVEPLDVLMAKGEVSKDG